MSVDPNRDSELIRRWRDGDSGAARSLLRTNLGWVRAYVRKRVQNVDDADDLVHDAVIDFLRGRPRFVPANRAQFRGLLGRIALNVVRDRLATRRARRLGSQEISQGLVDLGSRHGAVTPPERAAERDEWRDWVHVGLELVSPDDRELIRARVWSEQSFAEIASRFGIATENAARMRFQRALGRLAREIDRVRRGTR
jgi:RNA polymerase sigma factor (sigma-70 family)